jgi:hypothetical protein
MKFNSLVTDLLEDFNAPIAIQRRVNAKDDSPNNTMIKTPARAGSFGNLTPNPKAAHFMLPSDEEMELIGTCIDEDLVNTIFGSMSEFGRQVEMNGDNFKYHDIFVLYDEDKDIHSFYQAT